MTFRCPEIFGLQGVYPLQDGNILFFSTGGAVDFRKQTMFPPPFQTFNKNAFELEPTKNKGLFSLCFSRITVHLLRIPGVAKVKRDVVLVTFRTAHSQLTCQPDSSTSQLSLWLNARRITKCFVHTACTVGSSKAKLHGVWKSLQLFAAFVYFIFFSF